MNKSSDNSFQEYKKNASDRLKTKKQMSNKLNALLAKAADIEEVQVHLKKYIPENLQDFCKISSIKDANLVVFVYPSIYLRQIKAKEKQIIANIRADFPEKYSHLKSIECKVRPLDNGKLDNGKNKPKFEPTNTQFNQTGNSQNLQSLQETGQGAGQEIEQAQTREIPESIKQNLLEISKQTQDPALKAQLEKMSSTTKTKK